MGPHRLPCRFRLLPALALLLLAPAPAAAHSIPTPHDVHAGMRWEQVLTSSATYSNPYRHLLLQVQWTCVSNCSQDAANRLPRYGFWDGGATFKIRALFPQPEGNPQDNPTSTWRWATTCSRTPQGIAAGELDCSTDGGLNSSGEQNTVTVAQSGTTTNGVPNRLYQGGGLLWLSEGTVSEGGQLVRGNLHLAIPDDDPFYWLGDTAWAASVRARFDAASTPNCNQASGWNTNDWKCYLQDRVARTFSVIQISVPRHWMKSPLQDPNGQAPFVNDAAFPAWSKWNPAFWRGFDDKIQYANDQGLVVVVVGIMAPSYSNLKALPPLEDGRTFGRNLAARLAGNVAILSPSFDDRPEGGAVSNLTRAVGAELDATLPRHRIVNHFGGSTPVVAAGPWNDYRDFHGEPWLDFHLFQSGQCNNLPTGGSASPAQQLQNFTHRARHMPQDLRAFSPRKGSANGEAIYDFEGAVLEPVATEPANALYYRPYRVRHTAYLSTLSGAFGYTLGVYGLFDWGLGDPPIYQPRTPRNSVNRPSVRQMQHLANLFRSHRWWWLAPAPALIRNNPVEPDPNNFQFQHLQMVASRDLTRRSTLAYLPDNGAIHLQLNNVLYPGFTTSRWRKRFRNPRTGQDDIGIVIPTLVAGTTDVYRFVRPPCPLGEPCNPQNGDRDWVLVLVDTTAGAPLWAGNPEAGILQTWSAVDPDLEQWTIRGQLFDASGQPAAEEIPLSASTSFVQRLPQAVRGAAGEFLVVWEAEELDGDGAGIFGRLVGASGAPLGEPFQVNAVSEGRQTEPMVTADGVGRYVVVWTTPGPGSDGPDVVARRFSAQGDPLGDELAVASAAAGAQHSPLVSAEPSGGFVVGWMSDDPELGTTAIAVRRFDAKGNPVGAELEIEASATAPPVLERLEMDALGNFQVIWQRLLEGESQGHFAVSFDRSTESLGATSLVAEGWN